MPTFAVHTASRHYPALVERGALDRLAEFLPARIGRIFVVTADDVWLPHGTRIQHALAGRDWHRLTFPGGEQRKRLAEVEALAEQMAEHGADRSSLVISFGGGIVTDLGGFLASIFMRGIPVIQVPTTLLSQVDAGVGGKTGANLTAGKNLVGTFYQPLAVVTDPDVLSTLPEREYRAGLFEVLKHGIIASEPLFRLMQNERARVLALEPAAVERMVSESVRIKAEVVSADERESGLRRILNFGHTVGHAFEAETGYARFLHGEAVGLGMKAALHLSSLTGRLDPAVCAEMIAVIDAYGPFPALDGIRADALAARLVKDKKTIQGSVHFVLATGIGTTEVTSGIDPLLVGAAIEAALR
jgi:3-dehydroquinate synthase